MPKFKDARWEADQSENLTSPAGQFPTINSDEPVIYTQLRLLAEDAVQFREALKLLASVHGIVIVELNGKWAVAYEANLREHPTFARDFPTFVQAFAFALGLLEVKK